MEITDRLRNAHRWTQRDSAPRPSIQLRWNPALDGSHNDGIGCDSPLSGPSQLSVGSGSPPGAMTACGEQGA